MRRVAIFLRNTGAKNKFRRAILNTLRTSYIDEALICSGFFQEDGKYSAGSDFDLITYRLCSPLKVTVLGLYSYSWKSQFSNFFKNFNNANKCLCFSATQKRILGMRWHAKVFIAKKAGNPVVGIIGSSNITRRAFAEVSDFNYECDVVLWDESIPEIDAAINAAIGDFEDISDVIVTNYDDNHRTNQRTLQQRLIALEAEILTNAVDVENEL